MKVWGLLVLGLGLTATEGAFAQNKVQVTVKRIVIDNSEGRTEPVSFKTVCVANGSVQFQDASKDKNQNAQPEVVAHNCKFEYLGKEVQPKIWVGSGVFLENGQQTFAIQGVIKADDKANDGVATGWVTSKQSTLEDVELTVESPIKTHPTNPERSESLRVTYKFYK